jgi:hypothetical protein
MRSRKIFEDGSSIEWVNVQTVLYTEGAFSTSVWNEAEPSGFFSSIRVIMSSTITKWDTWPAGSSQYIDENKKKEIIDKVCRYFKGKCREETPEERADREKREAESTFKTILEDGSSIEPINKEQDKYTAGDFSVIVNVIYKSGLFADRYVIKASSIMKWGAWPAGSSEFIDENKRQEIIAKFQEYYKRYKKKCIVEI